MPSFRITPSEALDEKRRGFQADLENAGILDLCRKGLTEVRKKFMEDDSFSDPMSCLKKQLGIPEINLKEIDDLRAEVHSLREELKTYDEDFSRICNEEENRESFCTDSSMYGIFYCKDENKAGIKSQLDPALLKENYTEDCDSALDYKSLEHVKSKFKSGMAHSTPIKDNDSNIASKRDTYFQNLSVSELDLDFETAKNTESDNSKPMGAKPKLRIPGGPMVESKREECRKMMEKFGILQFLERGLASLLVLPEFPENPIEYLRENLRTHSLEFHEVRALKREIIIINERLDELRRKKDDDNESNFSYE